MKFPPIDEPTIVVVNGLVERCETARRYCRTALDLDPDQSLHPLLRRTEKAYERVVAELRDGLFGSAGEAAGDGTLGGFFDRIAEAVGQKGGWRDDPQLIAALDDQQATVLEAFDAAIDDISDDRIRSILAAQRSMLADLKNQTEAAIDDT